MGPSPGGGRARHGADSLFLEGIGRRRVWPGTPGSYTEDDVCVDPGLGLAIVARGSGAIGGQGKPAGKLAVWSIAGEVAAGRGPRGGEPSEALLSKGFARANEAVARLSASWPRGLGAPFATAAAVLLDGPAAVVAHLGDCRVSRLGEGGLSALTREHTIGSEHPDLHVPAEIARIVSRGIGTVQGSAPEIRRVPVQAGDVLLLQARMLEDSLSTETLTGALLRAAEEGSDLGALADSLVRAAQAGSKEHGVATFAIARVVGAAATGPVSRGTMDPPRLRWLFAPGEALADPPSKWAAGAAGRGPDAEWFSEVHRQVMGSDDKD